MLRLSQIWQSWRRLPLWVMIWVALILVPINLASLLFVAQPFGVWIAVLAVMGMAINVPIILIERGFSKLMSLPHLILWTPLVALIAWALWFSDAALSSIFAGFLVVLLVIDVVSLVFDYPDFFKWLRGDRATA